MKRKPAAALVTAAQPRPFPKHPKRWWRGVQDVLGKGEITVDIFAGAAGWSTGMAAAQGFEPHVAINHSKAALAIYRLNHPTTHTFCCDVREVHPSKVMPNRAIGWLHGSPDCRHHSKARGKRPVSKSVRALANVLLVWIKTRRPRIFSLENVEEFLEWGPLDKDGMPIEKYAGRTFNYFVQALRREGYEVEWKVLVAADYGVPTIRKRLFLVARRDGKPIRWPKPTHAKRGEAERLGLKTWVPAHTCIDFTLPSRSIFERGDKPLKKKTLDRIRLGMFKHAINDPAPFLVTVNHGGKGFRGQSLQQPFLTMTSKKGEGLVVPTLIQMGYGERKGQKPRVPGLRKPLGTITAKGNKFALVQAFLAAAGGPGCSMGRPGSSRSLKAPLQTILKKNSTGLVTVHLSTLRGSSRSGRSAKDPMPAITSQGLHIAEVRAFLVKYYGSNRTGASLKEPLHTLTTKERMGLVEVHGEPYQIADITFRMLKPRELLNGQFGPRFAPGYKLVGTDAEQVFGIGNSVPPEMAFLIVKPNW